MGMDTSGLMFPKSNPVDDREDRKRSQRRAELNARRAVWARDQNRDRSTGRRLARGDMDPAARGECCHLRGRNVAPEMRTDPNGQILLSMPNHDRFDGRSSGRLKAFVPGTTERATDASKPILFVFYDKSGKEIARRIS